MVAVAVTVTAGVAMRWKPNLLPHHYGAWECCGSLVIPSVPNCPRSGKMVMCAALCDDAADAALSGVDCEARGLYGTVTVRVVRMARRR